AGIVVLLSNTRILILGLAIIVISFFLLNKVSLGQRVKTFLIIFFGLLLIYSLLISLGYNFEAFYDERLIAETDTDENHRLDSYNVFLQLLPEYFLWGTGSHISDAVTKFSILDRKFIHIGWLSNIIAFGIFITFFLVSFYFYFVRDLFKDYKVTQDFSTFISFILFVVFNFTYINLDSFTSGLMLTLVFNQYYLQQKKGLTFNYYY
ncbi:MAG: O-antigen ligase family protein, partial [Bacteroidota bacterium]|nr:O-antigen ligase family protein [Bacteroidota bacterium]